MSLSWKKHIYNVIEGGGCIYAEEAVLMIAFDLRTAAQSVEAALSSGIGSLIKFSVIEGFVMPAELGCFIIENRHKLVALITFPARSKH